MTRASVAPPRASPSEPVSAAAAAARILAFGRQGFSRRRGYGNIASPVGVAQYTAIAADVAGRIGTGRVLDWGAGWGQNSLLLHALGARVTAYDVEDKGAAEGLLAGTGIPYVVDAAARLPFADGEFDAVLNCGVLEHVADERAALAELRRVLRPRGLLFTYHLPNRHAWTEWLGRRLGRFHHERTYTRREARQLFEAAGFRVVGQEPFHLLPRNAWAQLPSWLTLGERGARTLTRAETALTHLPGLARFSTAWSLLAERA